MSSYPKWLYHKTEEAKLVTNEGEHKELGEGWEESPTAFEIENPKVSEPDLSKMTAKELQALAMKKGLLEDANGVLSKKELIKLIEGSK